MKKRDSRKADEKNVFFFPPFRRKILSVGGVRGEGRGGINFRAVVDKLNPKVKDQDIFPSEGYVGKCEYLSKRGAESCEWWAHVGKVGWNMLDKLDFVSSAC